MIPHRFNPLGIDPLLSGKYYDGTYYYTPLSGIAFGGDAYFNSGIIIPNTTTVGIAVEVKCYILTRTSSIACFVFGTRPANDTSNAFVLALPNTNKVDTRSDYASVTTSLANDALNAVGNPRVYVKSNNVFSIDGVVKKTDTITSIANPNYPLYIGALNEKGTAIGFFYGTINYLKITKGGTLVRDFKPCVRDNNATIIGLFDTENNVFYNKLGSGNVTAE
jgi:hypothetical protein